MTPIFSRREMIQRLGGGIGGLALANLLAGESNAAPTGPHFAPTAKRVIHLFMNGGPFGPDFLDPKPDLTRFAGQRPAEVDLRTERQTFGLMAAPFRFRRHGRSGVEV